MMNNSCRTYIFSTQHPGNLKYSIFTPSLLIQPPFSLSSLPHVVEDALEGGASALLADLPNAQIVAGCGQQVRMLVSLLKMKCERRRRRRGRRWVRRDKSSFKASTKATTTHQRGDLNMECGKTFEVKWSTRATWKFLNENTSPQQPHINPQINTHHVRDKRYFGGRVRVVKLARALELTRTLIKLHNLHLEKKKLKVRKWEMGNGEKDQECNWHCEGSLLLQCTGLRCVFFLHQNWAVTVFLSTHLVLVLFDKRADSQAEGIAPFLLSGSKKMKRRWG